MNALLAPTTRLAVSIALLVAIGTACPPGDDGNPPPEPKHHSTTELVDAELAFFNQCDLLTLLLGDFGAQAEPQLLQDFPPSRQTLLDQLQTKVDSGAYAIDQAALDGCIAALSAITTCPTDLNAFNTGPAQQCGQVVNGIRAVGEGCGPNGDECVDGAFCSQNGACGTCTAPPGAGDPCPDFQCADGLVCAGDPGTCAAAPGAGQPCPDFECAAGLTCNADNVCEAPAAAPVLGLGDACTGSCNVFRTGLFCNQTTQVCEQAAVVQPGATCEPGQEVAHYCINQSARLNACADPDGDSTFTCTALPGPGDPCLSGDCSRTAACDQPNDTCIALPGDGAACPDGQCADGFQCNDASVCAATSTEVCPA